MNLKQKVWITKPSVHGNGGWCGDRLLSSKRGMQLARALKILNPYKKYDEYFDFDQTENLGAIRICSSQDSNDTLYYFDGYDWKWVKA